MTAAEAKEGLRVYDNLGTGTIHKNVDHPEVSEWFIKWDNDLSECAILDFEYLNILES